MIDPSEVVLADRGGPFLKTLSTRPGVGTRESRRQMPQAHRRRLVGAGVLSPGDCFVRGSVLRLAAVTVRGLTD